MSITWSPQQERALDLVGRWIRTRSSPYFTLAGYAGTGKSTLAKHFASSSSGEVLYAAYTGKAAHVLRRQGIDNVKTIHQLIYTPRDKADDKLRDLKRRRDEMVTSGKGDLGQIERQIAEETRFLKSPDFAFNDDSELGRASLLILDEYSMVDEQIGRDLLSFGVPVLALGDPGQLPPVQGRRFFTAEPDVMLTEIHRQAKENPIIRMSWDIREGRGLKPGTYGRSRVVKRGQLSAAELASLLTDADQLLVGMNRTRRSLNQQMRRNLGHEDELPERDDKLVCLRNNHREGLLNGQIWTVLGSRQNKKTGYLTLRIESDDGYKVTCLSHPDVFLGAEVELADKKSANEFDYGYALTVHKAQGSQWSNVTLLDEWHGRQRKEWLYTAITRAAEAITVIQ